MPEVMPDKKLLDILRSKVKASTGYTFGDSDLVSIMVAVHQAKAEWENDPNHTMIDVYDTIDSEVKPWPTKW